MDLTLIRSSTLRITFGELRLLFDPYLAPKGGGRSYGGAHTSPLSDLPYPIETILADIDAVLVSHLHSDHFDDVARERLPRDVPILCHERDKAEISKWGFSHVKGFDQPTVWRGVTFVPTAGLHGPPEVQDELGFVSGFVLKHPDEPTLYLVGDSILCEPVVEALKAYAPSVIVAHAAGAVWLGYGPIVMDEGQIVDLLALSGEATVIATHLDTVDHATVTRRSLHHATRALPSAARLMIPKDGATMRFSSVGAKSD